MAAHRSEGRGRLWEVQGAVSDGTAEREGSVGTVTQDKTRVIFHTLVCATPVRVCDAVNAGLPDRMCAPGFPWFPGTWLGRVWPARETQKAFFYWTVV